MFLFTNHMSCIMYAKLIMMFAHEFYVSCKKHDDSILPPGYKLPINYSI